MCPSRTKYTQQPGADTRGNWGLTALAQAQESLSMVRLCLTWAIVSMKVRVVLGSAHGQCPHLQPDTCVF